MRDKKENPKGGALGQAKTQALLLIYHAYHKRRSSLNGLRNYLRVVPMLL